MSAALGFGWLVLYRHRWGLMAMAAGFALLLLAVHLAPSWPTPEPQFVIPVALGLFCSLLFLMAIFTFPEVDLLSMQSGYPAHLLALPVRTAEPALWPVLAGGAAVALAWLAAAGLLLRPLGVVVPLIWPAAGLAAMLACVQALSWWPMPLPFLRLALTFGIAGALVYSGLRGLFAHVPPAALVEEYLAAIVLAAAAATGGVAVTRRGGPGWPRTGGRAAGRAEEFPSPATRRPFRSRAAAQLWLEWRQSGLVLPLITLLHCIVFSLPLLWVHESVEWSVPWFDFGLYANVYIVNFGFAFLLLPLFYAWLVGGGLGRTEGGRRELALPSFLATRPMASADMVMVKFKSAGLSALASLAILLSFALAYLLAPGQGGEDQPPILLLLLQHSTPGTVALVSFAVLVLGAGLWRNQVQRLFTDLSGRAWLALGYPVAYVVIPVLGYGALLWADTVGAAPAEDRATQWIGGHLWLFACVILALKLAAAWWVFRTSVLEGALSVRAVEKAALAWVAACTAVLAVLALLWVLLLPQAFQAVASGDGYFLAPLIDAMSIGILYVPLVRVAAVPLSLDRNRRR